MKGIFYFCVRIFHVISAFVLRGFNGLFNFEMETHQNKEHANYNFHIASLSIILMLIAKLNLSLIIS